MFAWAQARWAGAPCGHRFTPPVGFCDHHSVGHAADDRQAADMQAMAHDLHGERCKQTLARRADPVYMVAANRPIPMTGAQAVK